ncbi:roundabout homolog 3-like [Orbicella faveolata]|uniref:roundabout homolog 3-like n=1 Tax=Orbicella faveolata TaxID=48498 RepID=UPI0009E39CBF|nr:roundabout homolog 3-like [Orbicella faveolata]
MGISGAWMKTMETAGEFVFRCEANNSIQGIGKSGNTTFTTDVPASVEQVNNKVVKEGGNVEVYCNVTAGIPDPTVYWSKVETGEHITGNPLNITNTSRAQAGEYRCTANNTCGEDSTVVVIDVQYPPVITREEGHIIDAFEGDSASIFCPILGNPHPNVTWHKGNDTSSDTVINTTNPLEFLETALDDSGWYTCFAENSLGNVTVTVQLHVEKSVQTTVTTLLKTTTKVVESTISATATIDESCDKRLDVEKRFPSLDLSGE